MDSSSTSGRKGGGLLLSPPPAAVVVAVAVLLSAAEAATEEPCYPRLFSFGDSLTDTGNFAFIYGNDSREPALRPPYGETFFHRATGRFSDGRLVVDFIADALGLPFVRPYLSGRTAGDFACGANFAVGGATALSPAFFRARGVPMADIVHLDMEMKWFRDLLKLLCPGDLAGCTGMMNQSLFLVGEIGGNDYNLPLLSGVSITKIRSFTPSVIAKISSTITELIGLGAKTLVVPGNLPIGCVPNYLMIFKSGKKEDYEPETGCLRWMNEFSQYHNKLLIDELEKLRKLHPDVAIIYADYYGAAMEVFLSPEQFGIEDPLTACCGGGGPYGVSGTARCGYGEYKVCDDPQKFGSWDGFHPSEAAYKAIAIGLLRGSYTQPSFATTTNSCPQITELSSSVEYKVLYDLTAELFYTEWLLPKMVSSTSGGGAGLLSPPAVVLAVAVVLSAAAAAAQALAAPCYLRVFSFGDSLADTGNLWPPYGETFFHRATGRCSDGRLIIDFIAEAMGLPFVRPYWGGQTAGNFASGANFAVGGATALSPEFFRERGVPMDDDTVHLDMEMEWFRDLLGMLCTGGDMDGCKGMMNQSLFLVGEIGGNDYNLPLMSGMSIEKIRNFTPSVIAKISSIITELIGLGAKTLVVPGNIPIGCIPMYLMQFESDKKEDYEPKIGCLRWMNEFSQYHNKLLVDELENLRKLHPDVTIIYADYYGAAMEVFLSPERFGIEDPLVACCGGRGPYGVSASVRCGYGEYKVCDDPAKYASWDGFHPSEAAYKGIAIGLLQGSYTQPPIVSITNSCPQIIGLGIENPLAACCGGGGPYGVSETARCGHGEYKVCDDPQLYGSWDGYHPSEAVFKAIAIGLLRGSYTQAPLACPQIPELGSSVEYKRERMASSTSGRRGAAAVVLAAVAVLLSASQALAAPCYPRVFSFGDSLTDTGNIAFLYGNDSRRPTLWPPYGETFFHRATGRASNGRLIIDFIADALGLPFVRPYWSGRTAGDFAHGANFAVGGATALSPDFYRERGVHVRDTVHLDMEMNWFRDLLGLLCPDDLAGIYVRLLNSFSFHAPCHL
uniref:GDSL esterase/lipase n=1 Tax=Oryza glumipatula TaxID=40148 RepID=A0A0D9YCG5_9ORYZ